MMDLEIVAIVVLAVVDAVLLVVSIHQWSMADTYHYLLRDSREDRDRLSRSLGDARMTIGKQNRLIHVMALGSGIESPVGNDEEDDDK